MRLLHSETLELKNFYDEIPEYAILSHTWLKEEEEPTCQDIMGKTGTDKPGYIKIKNFCAQAAKDYEYVWVDTCCIDKTNNVELQEAINSMFKWYRGSEMCFAYLSDYDGPPIGKQSEAQEKEFRESKWFTRGWTLQELIAPPQVKFYNFRWEYIGIKAPGKAENCKLLSEITHIDVQVLSGEKDPLKHSSIAQRMSWASNRKTTRPEDIA
jgi:Heterokaryon incompatibility protein (HET)